MRKLSIAALALSTLALPRLADAFCGFYVSGADTKLVADATQVVLMRDGTRTVLAMQNDYKGPPEDFAMVIPVPVVLQKENVKTLPRDVFARVDSLSAPRLVEYWEQNPCPEPMQGGLGLSGIGAGGGGSGFGSGMGRLGGAEEKVKVEAKFEVGEYDVVILSSQSSSALYDWLKENKYKIPDDAEPMLKPYVQAGSKFFVAKVNVAKITLKDGVATLSPLRFHYDSEKFELPVRLGLVNSAGKQDLVVQILSPDKRYEVANYPNVTIPTNLDVAESARERFGDFYASLLDDTLAKNPNAVVTEYAWPASNCDPCPGGSTGLSVNDVVTLGADVLPSVIARGGATTSGSRTSAPSLRQGAIQVSGKLPPEVIQRIVRQNFGRFRLCYENGLKTNPNLQGRITTRFVIGKDGGVRAVTPDPASTVQDASVVSCVANGMRNLSFPTPETGEVSVEYPIVFSPSSPFGGSGFGGLGSSNLPAFVLTRLHARYGKASLGADLVFKEAPPIRGGRENRENGKLEEGSTKSEVNNFQARYAIRHSWTGPITCKEPQRGVWGGPWPDAGVSGSETKAATKTAYAKRDGVSLGAFLTSGAVNAQLPTTSPVASDAGPSDGGATDGGATDGGATPAPSSGKCGCRAVGSPASPALPLGASALLALAMLRRSRRPRGASRR